MAKRRSKEKESRSEKNKLSWNWLAFLLGPLWYFIHGLWLPGLIMIVVLFMSGFIFVLPIAIYCGIRFDEDLQELQNKKEEQKIEK